ncbi:MAG: methyltransferase, TrmA family [Myxococcaceae bacterium]|nr:methyltransferase, TrmA family [Myxococcaceae bacterium]
MAADEAKEGAHRVACEHAEECGGCPIISLTYDEQLALKRGRVVQSVSRYGALELVYTEPVAAADPVVEYRTRAKLIVAAGGKIGLFAKGGGHHIVDIPNCRVLAPPLVELAALLRERCLADEGSGGVLAPFDPNGRGAVRAIDLREVREGNASTARVLVTLVVQRSRVNDVDAYRDAARQLAEREPLIAGVALNFHEGDAPQILGSETVVLWGAKASPDRVGASTHLATFGSFVQAHRGQAARVHTMLAHAFGLGRPPGDAPPGPRPRVLDLYGGSGAIALGLAASGADVHLVESFPPAADHARAAAESQGLSVTAECGDVAAMLRAIEQRGERFKGAVVNPPRRGMSPSAREQLSKLDVDTIAYVSCDPDTLARDLDHFTRLGYATTELRPLDMIPLTDEVETVAVLRRSAAPRPRVAYEDDEILVVEKSAHETTLTQSDLTSASGGSLQARVRRISGAEAATPVHRLDVGTSGLVVFVKKEERLAAWTAGMALPTTRKIYVAAARGVTPSKGAITRDLREDGVLYTARTRYRRLAVASGHSVLRVIPEQGRTHQIRRHLAAIGHPVIGDDRYGHPPTNRFFEEKNGLDRAFLHCVRIEIDHPTKQARLVVEAPLPGDLRAVLERTSGPGTLRFLDHKNALGTSGPSSLPPPPDSRHERGSVLEIDASAVSVRPESTEDDDEAGARRSRGF